MSNISTLVELEVGAICPLSFWFPLNTKKAKEGRNKLKFTTVDITVPGAPMDTDNCNC